MSWGFLGSGAHRCSVQRGRADMVVSVPVKR